MDSKSAKYYKLYVKVLGNRNSKAHLVTMMPVRNLDKLYHEHKNRKKNYFSI